MPEPRALPSKAFRDFKTAREAWTVTHEETSQ